MLYCPANEFGFFQSNTTARPASAYGTQVTTGTTNNLAASYTQLIASTTQDCFLIRVNINTCNATGDSTPTLLNIAIGGAGAETVIIPDLACTGAGGFTLNGGVNYEFPLYVPAGTRISANARQYDTTVSPYVYITMYGKPSNPSVLKVGSYVTSFGANIATSGGTAVTSGTTSEGAWTSLATTTKPHWFWQCGWTIANTDVAWTAIGRCADIGIGDASNKRVCIDNMMVCNYGTAEAIGYFNPGDGRATMNSKAGDIVYGRLQNSSTAETGEQLIAYGVGG